LQKNGCILYESNDITSNISKFDGIVAVIDDIISAI